MLKQKVRCAYSTLSTLIQEQSPNVKTIVVQISPKRKWRLTLLYSRSECSTILNEYDGILVNYDCYRVHYKIYTAPFSGCIQTMKMCRT